MFKYAALLVVAVLMAAAFFLPEWLSGLNDRRLLDSPSIQVQDQEREGFAESVQLTVAEKLIMLRSGTLNVMELGQERVEGAYTFTSGGMEAEISMVVDGGGQALLKAAGEAAFDVYQEELSRLWKGRLASVRTEVRNLQAMGGLPELWSEDGELAYTGCGELLYMDPNTRLSFQVYQVSLSGGSFYLELMVDEQSERILSFRLQWGKEASPGWGVQGASSFGSAWRNYWGLDSVSSDWYNSYNKNILEQVEESVRTNGDYSALGQIAFTYDGVSIAVPLDCMARGGRSFAINWNN